MINVGPRPILWHILKTYSHHGINDFVICCGYKAEVIKEFFANYALSMSDVTFDLRNRTMKVHQNTSEPWKVTLVDTGLQTMTGGRLRRVKDYLDGETFCMTYGDGVSNIDITESVRFHKQEKRLATLTAVQPVGRFGAFTLGSDSTSISTFHEKPKGDGAWINGGYFVLEPGVIDYIAEDSTVWERDPLEKLAKEGQLSAYKHSGFWHPMDTLRDKMVLEEHWESGKAPWKVWED